MEVLKHGDAWKEKHNITTCRSCGCEFIYNEDDTEELTVYARTLVHPIRCPECGHAESHFCNGVMITNNSICGPRVIHCSESSEKEE